MGHKMIIAKNLRRGLARIKEVLRNQEIFETSPFKAMWHTFNMRDHIDFFDCQDTRREIEFAFAARSRAILARARVRSGD